MADTFANEHRFYDTEARYIHDLFQKTDEDPSLWPKLTARIDEALENPALPRFHRAGYEIMRAWDSVNPEEHIQRANTLREEMQQLYIENGKDDAWIKERLAGLDRMIAASEEAAAMPDSDVESEHEDATVGKDSNARLAGDDHVAGSTIAESGDKLGANGQAHGSTTAERDAKSTVPFSPQPKNNDLA